MGSTCADKYTEAGGIQVPDSCRHNESLFNSCRRMLLLMTVIPNNNIFETTIYKPPTMHPGNGRVSLVRTSCSSVCNCNKGIYVSGLCFLHVPGHGNMFECHLLDSCERSNEMNIHSDLSLSLLPTTTTTNNRERCQGLEQD